MTAPNPDPNMIAIVGAGPGVGAAVAHRFARAGFDIGLVARNADRLATMATELEARYDARCATATADASAPEEVHRALAALTSELGAISALCFSPIPDVGLIRPVLETGPEDLMGSLRLNVGGAAAAVRHVLPAMLDRGHGSLLFTTGSGAISPDQARAASAVTTTAATAYIALLRAALEDTGVRVGHTVIAGPIAHDRADAHHPDAVADDVWAQHEGSVADFPSVLRLS